MPSTAPLMSTPSGTPCGTGTPRRCDVVRRPNASSTATTTPTDQPTMSTMWRSHRGSAMVGNARRGSAGSPGRLMTRRSHAGRELRLPAGDVRELVAPATVQRDVGAPRAVCGRRGVGVPVDLADVRDAGVVVAAPVDEDEPWVVPLGPLVVAGHGQQAVLISEWRQLRPCGREPARQRQLVGREQVGAAVGPA